MPKPTTLPAWATDESNNTEPSSGQKATGWTTNQTGVSSYDNWWKKLTYDWLEWLDGYTDEEHTYAIHYFGFLATDLANSQVTGNYSNGLSLPGAGGHAYAPILLPVGSVLRECVVTYNRNGAGIVTPAIGRYELATNTGEVLVLGVADSSGSAIETQTLDLADHVVEAGWTYYVNIVMDNTANRFYGAEITYTNGAV